ncbi:MAG: peptidyl-prolyl cis-trans isomerase SurA [Methylophagaceae bacterium]|jgi:peptidyl-prolyl cis-trans isomerase SurA
MIRFLFLFLSILTSVSAQQMDRIVAVVNDEVVLESELFEMAQTLSLQLRKREVALPPQDVFISQVLERLILQNLQIQTASRIGIRLGDDDLNGSIKNIAQNNNMSLTQFRDVLERDGYDYGAFRETIRKEMIVSRLNKVQVGDKIIVSDREVDNFLATQAVQGGIQDAYHLLHILVSVPEAASPEQVQAAEAKLAKVQLLLANGGDFSEIASGYSDAQNALEGGELGWRLQGELPSLFSNVVPDLALTEVSDVIRGGGGFHLVKLADKKSQEEHMVKQTSASHILIKTNDIVSDEDAEKRLNTLRIRVENGENFTELARAHSDDMVSAIRGGSLGWSTPGTMVPEFEKQMNALADNEMSEVFKSRFGWHLILLHERREQNMAEEYKRSKAREQIHSRRMAEELETWTRQLRDEAYVEYRDL